MTHGDDLDSLGWCVCVYNDPLVSSNESGDHCVVSVYVEVVSV